MSYSGNEIAVIGIDLKFPGSNSVEEFWDNLCCTKESIRDITEGELELTGISADKYNKKEYIKRVSVCDDYDSFDAAFFGYSTHEAKTIDPQHRLFLQSCWKALEQAGYVPSGMKGKVGVFGSAGYNTYLINSLLSTPDYLDKQGYYDVLLGNDKDYLATRVSYKIGLTGPSVTVQTACSSSLVGVHLACQSLLLGESDVCLAGGVCVSVPCKKGYKYEQGFILSEDGHCRAFDKDSSGTVFGSGVGVVVLKRLEDAILDNDTIYSIIKATAVNNDGNRKIGYTAPSQEGQEDVLRQAANLENISPESIAFIEAHGTGTTLGDPIELCAIMNIWGLKNRTDNSKYPCAIGSVKSNIGHIDAAAGIAGLIKASLCIKHKTIVPTVHFKKLNANISFENTRFYIADKVEKINRKDSPIRAAVSAFGVGGTNVSIILEEPPERERIREDASDEYLIKVSAKNNKALERMVNEISSYLPGKAIGPLAYTLDTGRADFDCRTFLITGKDKNGTSYVQHINAAKENKYSGKLLVLTDVTLDNVSEWRKMYKQIGCFRNRINEWLKMIRMELGIQCDDIAGFSRTIAQDKRLQKLWPFVVQASWIMAIREITDGAGDIIGYGLGRVTEAYLSGTITGSEAIKRAQEPEIENNAAGDIGKYETVIVLGKVDEMVDKRTLDCKQLDTRQFWTVLGVLWQNGASVKWDKVFEEGDKIHVPAPTYSFDKTRYWYKEEIIESSFVWREKEIEKRAEGGTLYSGKLLLLGADNSELNAIAEKLMHACDSEVILERNLISHSLHNPEEFNMKLIQLIYGEKLHEAEAVRIICLWGMLNSQADGNLGKHEAYDCFYKLLYLCRYLNKALIKCKNISVILVNSLSGKNDRAFRNMLMSGITLTVPMEYPNITVKQVDIADELTAELINMLASEVYENADDKRVILRNQKRYTFEYENTGIITGDTVLKQNGVYIITGGTGNVGLLFAREIAQRVQADIYLLSKHYTEDGLSEEADEKAKAIREIIKAVKESGSRVYIKKTDAADYAVLSKTIAEIEKRHGSINGIIHAAGRVGKARNFAENIAYEDVVVFCQAKVEGAYNLNNIFKNKALDFCILISSTVSVLGGLGDCIYSGTNAVLNYMAQLGYGDKIPCLTVAFDYLPRVFADEYVAENDESVRSLLANQLTPDEFSKAFDQILSSVKNKFIIISKSNFNSRYNTIHDVRSKQSLAQNQERNKYGKVEIKQKVHELWKSVLDNDCQDNLNFFDAGGSSFLAIKLISVLNDTFEMKLSVKYIYEYPTVSLIAENIYTTLCDQNVIKRDIKDNALNKEINGKDDALVVIGMAGRFPGADNVDELWNNILNRKCHISHFQSDSDDNFLNAVPDGVLNKHVGARGIISDVDKFDYEFFSISKMEAELMDPQQRIFLECAWEALEDSGCINSLNQLRVGVFASQGISTYLINYLLKNGSIEEDYNNIAVINNSPDSLAARVSYVMNLTGVSKTVQTFCSSSLVALEEAIANIKNGRCDIAIAGGVNIVVPQQTGYIYNEGSIYSPDGNVRPFDDSANGTVFSNGAGIVVLARKGWAEQYGKQIYADVLSVGINNDGSQKASFLSPSVKGQVECITEAYERAGIMPENVAYIETHGTATKVGDPIEVHALTKAFEQFTGKKGYCAIGSIKGNIGHLDRAAGITSFIKGCLIVKNRCIPPIAFFDKANQSIEFEETPFYVNEQIIEYDEPGEMIVGVSALGVGGTNVHVVLGGKENEEAVTYSRKTHIFNFSANCRESLIRYLEVFSGFIASYDLPMQEAEMTLQLYRKTFNVRCSVVADSREELNRKLNETRRLYKAGSLVSKINTVVFKLNSELDKLIKAICRICEAERHFQQIMRQEAEKYSNKGNADSYDIGKALTELGTDGVPAIKSAIKSYFSDLLTEKVVTLFVKKDEANAILLSDERTVFVNFGYEETEQGCTEEIYVAENDISGFYSLISDLWSSGLDIDWSKYNSGLKGNMIHLPGYAFKKTSCWIGGSNSKRSFSNHASGKEEFTAISSELHAFCNESGRQFKLMQKIFDKGGRT